MNQLLKLTNAPFPMEFNGKPYEVKKASLDQVVKFMQRTDKYKAEGVPITQSWVMLVAYAVFLSLSAVDPSVTEEYVSANLPGGVDPVEVLTTLGFISPKRAALATNSQVEK